MSKYLCADTQVHSIHTILYLYQMCYNQGCLLGLYRNSQLDPQTSNSSQEENYLLTGRNHEQGQAYMGDHLADGQRRRKKGDKVGGMNTNSCSL